MRAVSVLRHTIPVRPPSSLRLRLLLATVLTGCAPHAHAAIFPVAPTPVQDPLVMNLTMPADAATRGMWSPVMPWSLVALHTAMLPSGLLASYGSPTGFAVQDGRTYDVWDPLKVFQNGPVHTTVPGVANIDSFCSTSALLPSGDLLVSGGIISPTGGVNDHGSVLLNGAGTNVRQVNATLAQDRYYSTMVTLPSGLPIILGGNIPYSFGWSDPDGYIAKGYMGSMTPEAYDPVTGWRSLFGATSRLAFGPDYSRYWYPHAWVAPNGKLFGISAEQMWSLDPTGFGTLTSLGSFKTPQNLNFVAANAAPNVGPTSTAVMYDIGKILQVGGNGRANGDATYSSSVATAVDINGALPIVRDVAPMNFGRQWANSTVLPTGKVVVTGGTTYGDTAFYNGIPTGVLAAEIWDPATGQWSVAAANAVYRGYHSTATLLQDGALLIAGGGVPGPVDNLNAEIYYPPYLFKTVNGQPALAPRPQVVSLSTNQIAHGQLVGVEVNAAAGISKVAFVRLGEVTHSFDTGQRYVPAVYTQAGNLLSVAAPASPNIAPPGYYQLVVVDGNGVPSTGVIVSIGTGMAAPTSAVVPASVASPLVGTGWSPCALEGGACSAAGTQNVAYGYGTQWVTKPVTGSIACNTAAFGGDPIYGTVKACLIQAGQVASAGGTTGGTGTAGGTGTGGTGIATTAGAGQVSSTPVQIGFAGTVVAAGSDGTIATINAQTKTILVSTTKGGTWFPLPGQFTDVAVIGANRYYAIGLDSNVYRFNGTGWDLAGLQANSIGVSSDGAIAVSNSQTQQVWYRTNDTPDQQGWRALPNTWAKRLAVLKGGSVYLVGIDGSVWRSDTVNTPVQIAPNASDIAATADGTIDVVSTDPAHPGTVWRKTGDNTAVAWTQMPAKGIRVASPNAGSLLTLAADGTLYRQ